MRVLVIDAIAPEGIAYLEERGFQVKQVSSKMPRTELFATIAEYEAIVTRSSTTVNAEFLGHARRLRFLGRAGVGVDNIDVEACSRQGVVVANAPYGNVVSAAEHTIGMLLSLVRKIPAAHEALKRLEWDRAISGSELFRKTAGVIGLGKVGSRVAARLRAFDMDVLVYDPYIPESRARDLGVRLTDLQTLLTQADIVTVHVPLSEDTENMLGARRSEEHTSELQSQSNLVCRLLLEKKKHARSNLSSAGHTIQPSRDAIQPHEFPAVACCVQCTSRPTAT